MYIVQSISQLDFNWVHENPIFGYPIHITKKHTLNIFVPQFVIVLATRGLVPMRTYVDKKKNSFLH